MTYKVPILPLTDLVYRRIHEGFVNLFSGKMNNTGTFTVTQSAATTVVTDPRCGPESVINYTPTTANASAEVGAGTIYISAKSDGSFTVTHANSATAGRTFDYTITG